MSFCLRVDSTEVQGDELCIRRRLIAGAYFGPQYIRLSDTAGSTRDPEPRLRQLSRLAGHRRSRHAAELYIANPNPRFAVGVKSLVEGLGSVTLRRDSIDLAKELSNPLFWGNFSVLYMSSESRERPYQEFLRLSPDDVNDYYTDFLSPLIDSDT